jgi:hypothetical protein
LALPIQPELTEAQLRYVVDCVREFVTSEPRAKAAVQQSRSTL